MNFLLNPGLNRNFSVIHTSFNRNVHLGISRARDAKVSVNVTLWRTVAEIDLVIVAVIFLGQIESELVVYFEVIETGTVERVAMVVVGRVALLASVANDSLCCAETSPRFRVAGYSMVRTVTRCTTSNILDHYHFSFNLHYSEYFIT